MPETVPAEYTETEDPDIDDLEKKDISEGAGAEDEAEALSPDDLVEAGRSELQEQLGDAEVNEDIVMNVQMKRTPGGEWLICYDGATWNSVDGDESAEGRLERLQAGPIVELDMNGNGGCVEVLEGSRLDEDGNQIYSIRSVIFRLEQSTIEVEELVPEEEKTVPILEASHFFNVEPAPVESSVVAPEIRIAAMEVVATTNNWFSFEVHAAALSEALDDSEGEVETVDAATVEAVSSFFPELVATVGETDNAVEQQPFVSVLQQLEASPVGTQVQLPGPTSPDGRLVLDVTTLTVHEPGRIAYSFAELPAEHTDSPTLSVDQGNWEIRVAQTAPVEGVAARDVESADHVSATSADVKTILRLDQLSPVSDTEVTPVTPNSPSPDNQNTFLVSESVPNEPPSFIAAPDAPAASVQSEVASSPFLFQMQVDSNTEKSSVHLDAPETEQKEITTENQDTIAFSKAEAVVFESVGDDQAENQRATHEAAVHEQVLGSAAEIEDGGDEPSPEPTDSPGGPPAKEAVIQEAVLSVPREPESVFINDVISEQPLRTLNLELLSRRPSGADADDQSDATQEDKKSSPLLPSESRRLQERVAA